MGRGAVFWASIGDSKDIHIANKQAFCTAHLQAFLDAMLSSLNDWPFGIPLSLPQCTVRACLPSHFVHIRSVLANHLVCGQSRISALASTPSCCSGIHINKCWFAHMHSRENILTPAGVIAWLQRSAIVTHASRLLCMSSFTSLQNSEQYKFAVCIQRRPNTCVGRECCPKALLLSLNRLEMSDNRYLEGLKQLFLGIAFVGLLAFSNV
jgi:hypothetical protein